MITLEKSVFILGTIIVLMCSSSCADNKSKVAGFGGGGGGGFGGGFGGGMGGSVSQSVTRINQTPVPQPPKPQGPTLVLSHEDLSGRYVYSLDIMLDDNSEIKPCIGDRLYPTNGDYVFPGKCMNGKSVAIDRIKELTLVASKTSDGAWNPDDVQVSTISLTKKLTELKNKVNFSFKSQNADNAIQAPVAVEGLKLTWNIIANYHYSLDITLRDSGETIAPCIDAGILKMATSRIFDGKCLSQGDRQVDLENIESISIVAALNGNFQEGPIQNGSVLIPVPLSLDASIPVAISNGESPDDGTSSNGNSQVLPSEISLTWDRIANYVYSFDIKLKGADGENIAPCVDADKIGNLTAFKFNGTCSSAGNRHFKFEEIESLTIYAALNGDWENGPKRHKTINLTSSIDLNKTIHFTLPESSTTTPQNLVEQNKITVTWDKIPNYTYQLNITLNDGSVIAPCINNTNTLSSASLIFDGQCSAIDRERVDIGMIRSVTINAYGSADRGVFASGTMGLQNATDVVHVIIPIKVDVIGSNGGVSEERFRFSKSEVITIRLIGVRYDNVFHCIANSIAGLNICSDETNTDIWVGFPRENWSYSENIWSITFPADTLTSADYKIFAKEGGTGRRNNAKIHTID